MARYNANCIPQQILLRMGAKDKAELGLKTPEEIRKKNEAKSESELQKACESFLSRHGIEFLHLSPRAREKAGWPDLTCCVNGKPLAVELKTVTGKLSDDQKRVLAAMKGNGWQTHVLRSYEAFTAVVTEAME